MRDDIMLYAVLQTAVRVLLVSGISRFKDVMTNLCNRWPVVYIGPNYV